MKSFLQGIVTGAAVILSIVLFIAANEHASEIGRYQIIKQANNDAYFLLDTETGEVFFNNLNQDKKKYHWSKEPFIVTWHDYMAQ